MALFLQTVVPLVLVLLHVMPKEPSYEQFVCQLLWESAFLVDCVAYKTTLTITSAMDSWNWFKDTEMCNEQWEDCLKLWRKKLLQYFQMHRVMWNYREGNEVANQLANATARQTTKEDFRTGKYGEQINCPISVKRVFNACFSFGWQTSTLFRCTVSFERLVLYLYSILKRNKKNYYIEISNQSLFPLPWNYVYTCFTNWHTSMRWFLWHELKYNQNITQAGMRGVELESTWCNGTRRIHWSSILKIPTSQPVNLPWTFSST